MNTLKTIPESRNLSEPHFHRQSPDARDGQKLASFSAITPNRCWVQRFVGRNIPGKKRFQGQYVSFMLTLGNVVTTPNGTGAASEYQQHECKEAG